VHGDRALWPVAVLVALLKGVLLPALVVGRPVLRMAGIGRAAVSEGGSDEGGPVEGGPVEGAPDEGAPARRPSRIPVLLSAAGLVVVADLVARPLAAVATGSTGRALPVGLALVLVGFMLLVTGTCARAQLVGFLVLDNGIATTAFLATGGVPLVVELGASLDVLLVVLVLQVLGARLDTAFGGTAGSAAGGAAGSTDLDQLRELHD
jgi:hydrogenase-4 component E